MSQEELTKLKVLETMTQVSTDQRNNRDKQYSRANFGVISCQAEEEHKSDRQENVASLNQHEENSTSRLKKYGETAEDPLYMKIISPDREIADNDVYPNMANIQTNFPGQNLKKNLASRAP